MRKHISRGFLGIGTIVVGGLYAQPAAAYNWRTHSRMVEVATYVMKIAPSTNFPPPSGVTSTQWTNYLGALSAAATKLSGLRAEVANPGHESCSCGYDPTENMSVLPDELISQLRYLPMKGGEVLNGTKVEDSDGPYETHNSCSETQILPSCSMDNGLRLGKVLGWQAASVDERNGDSLLWVRPTTTDVALAGVAAGTTAGLGGALLGPLFGPLIPVAIGGAIVAGLACVADILFGGSCGTSVDGAVNTVGNLIHVPNPVALVNGALPIVSLPESGNYVGLWHFIDVAQFPGKTDKFNPSNPAMARGIKYSEAGPNGSPGAIDLSIMAASDLLGLSLDGQHSNGVALYGQFDQMPHVLNDWSGPTLAHVEFSPIDNLAQYGWTQFSAPATPSGIIGRSSAWGLSFELHALGDAAEPHHAAGTTAWGHRPYEDEVDNLLDTLLLPPPPTCNPNGSSLATQEDVNVTVTDAQEQRILTVGYGFYSKYIAGFATVGQAPIHPLIQDLAQQTYQFAHVIQSDSAYIDTSSTSFFLGGSQAGSTGDYGNAADQMRPLLELGTGAIMAFLTGASVTASPGTTTPGQFCPTAYDSNNAVCTSTIQTCPAPQKQFIGCLGNGSCNDAGVASGCQVCSGSADCVTGDAGPTCIGACCGTEPPR